jgi:hypothetical protein
LKLTGDCQQYLYFAYSLLLLVLLLLLLRYAGTAAPSTESQVTASPTTENPVTAAPTVAETTLTPTITPTAAGEH